MTLPTQHALERIRALMRRFEPFDKWSAFNAGFVLGLFFAGLLICALSLLLESPTS